MDYIGDRPAVIAQQLQDLRDIAQIILKYDYHFKGLLKYSLKGDFSHIISWEDKILALKSDLSAFVFQEDTLKSQFKLPYRSIEKLGQYLICFNFGSRAIKILDDTGKLISQFVTSQPIRLIKVYEDYIIIGSKEDIMVYSLTGEETILKYQSDEINTLLDISVSLTRITGFYRNGMVDIWDRGNNQHISSFRYTDQIWVSIRHLIPIGDKVITDIQGEHLELWDLKTQRSIILQNTHEINNILVLPSGNFIIDDGFKLNMFNCDGNFIVSFRSLDNLHLGVKMCLLVDHLIISEDTSLEDWNLHTLTSKTYPAKKSKDIKVLPSVGQVAILTALGVDIYE